MEFTQKQKAWILLVCIIIGTGGTTFVVNFAGGAVWWCALIGGLDRKSTRLNSSHRT